MTCNNRLEYWSEPADLFERRRKALSQRRSCVRIGDANPMPVNPLPGKHKRDGRAPPLPPGTPLPPGADAPRLVRDPKTGREYLQPMIPVPTGRPGAGQAAALKNALSRTMEAKRKRKEKEDKESKRVAKEAKKFQKERKKGPKKAGIAKHAPN